MVTTVKNVNGDLLIQMVLIAMEVKLVSEIYRPEMIKINLQQEDQTYILINICTQKQRQQQMRLLSQEEIISFMLFAMIVATLCS